MGHRANLVIVTETGYELYYDHWIAHTLPFQVFWGPEHALKLIRMQAQRDPDQWTDPVFAESGILIDPFEKVVLLFGGNYLEYELSFQAVFVECMRYQWAGWNIQWAYGQLHDFADYLGIFQIFCQQFSLLDNRRDCLDQAAVPQFQMLNTDDPVCTLLSIRFDYERLYFFPLQDGIFNLLYAPLDAYEALQQHEYYQTFDLSLAHNTFGECLHLDLQQQVVHVWSADINPNLQFAPHPWAGWNLRHYGYDFSQYHQIVDQQVILPLPDYVAIWEVIKTELLSVYQNQAFDSFAKIIAQSGSQLVQIPADTLKHHEYHLPLEQREALLAATEAAFRQAHGL